MTGTPDTVECGRAAVEPRGRPTLEPDEKLWLEKYLERLKKAPDGFLKRLVVYGSKTRGDAGPTSDVDVLVLVGETPDAVRNARHLIYGDDDPDGVDHNVVIRTEAEWLQDVDNELPFAGNVEAEGVQIQPVYRPYRPARRPPGDRPPVTRKGIRARAADLAGGGPERPEGAQVRDRFAEGRATQGSRHRGAPRFRRGFVLDHGVVPHQRCERSAAQGSPDERRTPPNRARRVEFPLAESHPNALGGVEAEVDWNPGRDAEPTIDDDAEWAETARGFCGLARAAIVADGIDIEPPDEAGTSGNAVGVAGRR